ncbi:MAG: class I SAM-dependent methyltransferase [Dehalococcoidia bacterium]
MNDYYTRAAVLYDETVRGVLGDIEFYRGLALQAGGPVVELGVGTGRVAVPIAQAGVEVIGIDIEAAMLAVAAERARAAGVESRLHLVEGDMHSFALDAPVELVIVPHRTFLHNLSEADQRATLRACYRALRPGGRLAFNVFNPDLAVLGRSGPSRRDAPYDADGRIAARVEHAAAAPVVTTWLRWREGGETRRARLTLRYVSRDEMGRLLLDAGFEVESLSGDFFGTPFGETSTEMVWVARRGSDTAGTTWG